MAEFEPVIGLEVHAQLRTATKIFCSCAVRFGAPPNSLTCPVCLGLPGALPVLNRQAVTLAVRMGLAVDCEIRERSLFARKNYFYPDLPKGYQISQFDLPLAVKGRLEIEPQGQPLRAIGITRIHMEEDAGKLIHEGPLAVKDGTLVDFNRAGVPLIEIVGEPELRSPEEAYDYLTRLKSILTYTEVCDGNMEEGSLRCDANVSIRPRGSRELGTRVELKNLNSFRNVERALRYEIARQERLVSEGGRVVQQTLLYDAASGETRPMRSKEEAHDYRYFPDPDLLPLAVASDWVATVRTSLPELPGARQARFVSEHGLSPADARILALERPLADWYEAVVSGGVSPVPGETAGGSPPMPQGSAMEGGSAVSKEPAGDQSPSTKQRPGMDGGPSVPPKEAAKRVLREIMAKMNEEGLSAERLESRYPPRFLAKLITLQLEGAINSSAFAEVFELSWERSRAGAPAAAGSAEPEAIVRELSLGQISDEAAIRKIVDEVMAASVKQVEQYRSGKDSVYGYFVGQVMKRSGGRANPAIVNRLLKDGLGR